MTKQQLVPLMLLASIVGGSSAFCQTKQSVTGFTKPAREIDLAASELGLLKDVFVKQGDAVEAGSVVASLDNSVLFASLKSAKRASESMGKLRSAQAELNRVKFRLNQLKTLRQRKHATQQEIENAIQYVEIAEANLEAVKDELAVKALELERIQAQLNRRQLRSPITGIVTHVAKDPGEFVSANDPVVLKIVQLNPLNINFAVPKQFASRLVSGSRLEVLVGPEESPISGTIEYVSPVIDGQSGTCNVNIQFNNPDLQWRGGEICKLTLSNISQAITKKDRLDSSSQVSNK